MVVNIGTPADEPMELPVDRRIAFAGRLPERLYVENMNAPAPIVDQAGFLKFARELAELILKTAAHGERDPSCLRNVALIGLMARHRPTPNVAEDRVKR